MPKLAGVPLSSPLLGMVHVGALPATPFARHPLDSLLARAVKDAKAIANAGFGGIIIENMHDRPYVHATHSPETVACMTRVALAVREAAPRLALGVQILSGGNKEALAVALACGGSFIRCENFVFAHVADEGLLPRAEAGELLRYRRAIGAGNVRVLADVKKKHASHAITSDVPLADVVHAVEFFGGDGVIVTGSATGREATLADVRAARDASGLPVLVGSGVTPGNAREFLELADAIIVGSSIKEGGRWENPVSAERCRKLVKAIA